MNAQTEKADDYPKLLEKLVLDIGTMPVCISNPGVPGIRGMHSYSIALGYQLTNKLDLRINNELYHFVPYLNTSDDGLYFGGRPTYDRLWAWSLGANYKAFKGKSGTYMEKTSLAFVGKVGFGLFAENNWNEAIYYDLSVRGYLGKIPYIGLGINQIFVDDLSYSYMLSFYFTFGLDI